jgi:DNA-binding transcriptional MerR regulator
MKLPKTYKTYTIAEIAFMLGISEKSVRNKIGNLKLRRIKTIGPNGNALYSSEQLELLRGDKRLRSLKRDLSYEQLLYERHHAPVVITYHIYESKMNKN